jgi:hypothetical protein
MKATSRALVILGLFGSGICALAGNITATFNDVPFDNGNTTTAAIMLAPHLSSEIAAANPDFYSSLPSTSAAGGVFIMSSSECRGCGTMDVVPPGPLPPIERPAPEPESLLVLGSSLAILGTMLRRKLSHA